MTPEDPLVLYDNADVWCLPHLVVHTSWYIKKYDAHVWIVRYREDDRGPSVSLMIKRIRKLGSLTMHFYYDSYMNINPHILNSIYETLRFSESFRYE